MDERDSKERRKERERDDFEEEKDENVSSGDNCVFAFTFFLSAPHQKKKNQSLAISKK